MTFSDLGLPAALVSRLAAVGYEAPSPIQAATIPALMEGRDVLGTAQTGTGKTAAFALPILSQLDLSQKTPQALVLAPTRELATQITATVEPLARAAEQLSYGPPRASSQALVGMYKDGKTPMAPHLPTAPENLTSALAIDVDFWAENDVELIERFAAWLAAE